MPKTTVTEALGIPFGDEHWIRKVLVGGLLLGIPILCFFSIGYIVAFYRSCLLREPSKRLPGWDAKESFLLGVKAFLICVLYFVPATLLLWLAHVFSESSAWATLLVLGVAFAIVGVVALPWGIALWLGSNRIKSAFSPAKLFKVVGFLGEYLDAFIRCLLLFIFSVGTVFVAFFVSLPIAYLLGEVCAKYLQAAPKKPADAP